MAVASDVVSWHSLRGRRDTNQDAALVRELGDGRLLVAVADGMGGHEGGADASRRAVEALPDALEAGKGLAEAVDAANAAVYSESTSNPSLKGMGTTLVALLGEGDRYWIANVGDSRAYRIERGRIVQLTVDHSFASEALGNGMTKEQIRASPWSNALTRSIGTDREVEIDIFGPFEADEAHWVCLCTDGLYRAVSDGRIEEIVSGANDLEGIPRRLADAAYAAGSADNITVALFAVGDRYAGEGARRTSTGDSSTSVRDGGSQDGGGGAVLDQTARYPRARPPSGKRKRRLSTKVKVELWGVAITVLLAAAAAYFVLNFL